MALAHLWPFHPSRSMGNSLLRRKLSYLTDENLTRVVLSKVISKKKEESGSLENNG